ncbi:hypothetical protein TKK_0019072 [Trichogramma kaykai]
MGDKRRFTIYFDICYEILNDETGEVKSYDNKMKIHGLKVQQYIKLKNNDAYAQQFCEKKFQEYNAEIVKITRSIDDVDYRGISMNAAVLNDSLDDIAEISFNFEYMNFDENRNFADNMDQNYIENYNENNDTQQTHEKDESSQQDENIQQQCDSASQVWQHATLTEDKSMWLCRHCEKKFKYSKNTSNLIQHLSKKHPLYFTYHKKEKTIKGNTCKRNSNIAVSTSNIMECFNKVQSYQEDGKMHDKITNIILYMISKDMEPISICTKEGFQALMKTVAPHYEIPSAKTLSHKLECKFDILKSRFMEDLADSICYCITADCWKDVSNQSYMGVTVSFLSSKYEWVTRSLGLFPLDERHNAEYLKSKLQHVFEKFKLDKKKLNVLINDGEQAKKNAAIEVVGIDKYLTCSAHKVSHLIPDVLKTLPVSDIELKKARLILIIEKMRNIIKKIRSSTPATDELVKAQKQNDISEGKILHLILDIEIRWTSLHAMVNRYLELETYIYSSMSQVKNAIDVLNREELAIMQDLVLLTGPIVSVIQSIGGEDYPTCGLIIPLINGLAACIPKLEPVTVEGKEFQNKLSQAISYRFKDFEFISPLAAATFCDPRYKKNSFQNSLAMERVQRRIISELSTDKLNINNMDHTSPPSKKSKPCPWDLDDMKRKNENLITRIDIETNKLHPELVQFYKLARLDRDEDPIKFWKKKREAFPNLAPLAVKYVAALATSVPSERLFSQAGLQKSKIRNRLNPETLNMIVFLHSCELEDWVTC